MDPTKCLTCPAQATTLDGLCGDCATRGSLRSAIWQVDIALDGHPAKTEDEVVSATRLLGWEAPASIEPLDPDTGCWLIELPDPFVRELLADGYAVRTTPAGSARIEVELP